MSWFKESKKLVSTALAVLLLSYFGTASARFVGVDPVAVNPNNIHSFNRYAYGNNNPYKYRDPDGREVVSVNPQNNNRILTYINANAAGTFGFDSQNRLQLVDPSANTEGKSTYYASRLSDAIASGSKISIELGETMTGGGITINVDSFGGGGVTYGDPSGSDQRVGISGNEGRPTFDTGGRQIRSTPGDVLMHELVGHAIPRIAGSDTGNSVANENKARTQIPGAGIRAPESERE